MTNAKFAIGTTVTVQVGNASDTYGYNPSMSAVVVDSKELPWGGTVFLIENKESKILLRATVKKGNRPSTDLYSTCAVETNTRTMEEAIALIW